MKKTKFSIEALNQPLVPNYPYVAFLQKREPTPEENKAYLDSLAMQEQMKLDLLFAEFGIPNDGLFAYRSLALALARRCVDGFKHSFEIEKTAGRDKDWTPNALANLLGTFDALKKKAPRKSSKEIYGLIRAEILRQGGRRMDIGAIKNRVAEARALKRIGKLPPPTPRKKVEPK